MTYDELLEAFRTDGWTLRASYSFEKCDHVAYKPHVSRFRCALNLGKEGVQIAAQIYDRRNYPRASSEWGVELILYASASENESFRLLMHGFDTFAEIKAGCLKLIKAWEALNETAL